MYELTAEPMKTVWRVLKSWKKGRYRPIGIRRKILARASVAVQTKASKTNAIDRRLKSLLNKQLLSFAAG